MSVDPELRAFIDGLSRDALAALLLDLAERMPAVADALAARRRAVGGDAQRLAATIRSELSGARRRSGPWPNFEAIRDKLALLRDAGAADAMCDLAGPILEAGADLIEETEDEGDLAEEVSACLDLVFAALPASSMSPDAQILWAIDMELRDPFDLCRGSAAVWDRPKPPTVWGQVADVLRARLDRMPPSKPDDHEARFTRDSLLNRLVAVLGKAGRAEEVFDLVAVEARRAGSYPRMVTQLRAAGRLAEAEQWARDGLAAGGRPGADGELRQAIRELRAQAGDWDAVAALQADAFFSAPSIHTLQRMLDDSTRAGVAPTVREAALRYLEDGVRPDGQAGWPLPPADPPQPTTAAQPFPQYELLIQLAIAEQRPADVLSWYDRARAAKARLSVAEDRIATAVGQAHPERAAAIWRDLATRQIAQANVRAYDEAARQLRRLRAVLPEPAWRAELEGLKAAHRRKPRLVEAIDRLLQEP
ncbi:hypothetical protein K2Z83_12860 [Oscillochloris sp. ZM17-4]|uniref:hypothetical protein n=1 Tax=Oscillochloris sp. ZM17-4 TaxID=2866714 RepID=UPI001C72C9B8|nr:hypothetical protein [Oscillochloris sp. ZM17-4]MBX0328568.1 hypothetical protein [Oscillochloris sp. ZM17-4]